HVLKLCHHHQQTLVRFKVGTDTSDTQPALRSRFAGDFGLFGTCSAKVAAGAGIRRSRISVQ
ncbi:MAG: hypothetical protein WAL15_03310, partial [Xanthobacteraceae bacterium]